MENKLSVKKIYVGIGILVLFIAISFHFLIYLFTQDIYIILSMLIYTIILIGCMTLFAAMLRRKINLFSNQLCQTIDNMVNNTEEIPALPEEEALLSRINHHLLKLYKIMRENRRKIDGERSDLQELVSDISHQVKTPIANLKMVNATLLSRSMAFEEQTSFLQDSDKQLDKLDFLMQSLVKTSRLETGIITLSEEPCRIYETIALALGDVLFMAEKKHLDITVDCDPDLVVCHDMKWISEAFFNILENAVKYTDYDGSIHISAERYEIYTKIDFKDDGKGIAPNHYTDIFKRFYREADVHHMEGIGIGLYLTRKIITMQGGYITVNSANGNGTTFSVFLLNK